MGDILKKITELLADGANIEQSRSTGIIISSSVNWFEALDGCTASDITPAATTKDRDGSEGKPKKNLWLKINEIP